MIEEFKKFIAQGNALDLAVAVIIAGAFGKIVTSVVNDILMPLIGLAMHGVNVAGQFIALNGEHYATAEDAKKAGVGVIAYGAFLQNCIDFIIIAFILFMIIRQLNKFKKPVPVVVEAPKV
jgi:large conductance mechanosensitive channel